MNVLSIVPYRILPAKSGGQLCALLLHDNLGKLCNDHLICTANNTFDKSYSFIPHKIFGDSKFRYIPQYKYGEIEAIAKENKIDHIICEHPYMAPTAISLSKKLRIPWYMRSHNIESERFRSNGKKWWPIMRLFERRMMQKADGIFFITPEDEKWAIENYNIKKEKSFFIPFGTILDKVPLGHLEAKKKVAATLRLDEHKPWLYFLGAMDIYPNQNALSFILNEIMPRLNKRGVSYQILIAGKGLPDDLEKQVGATPNIQYTGFIPDLDDFLNANDIMLNSVLIGGGIKTKAVEALGYNKFVISTFSGSSGLLQNACGENLYISTDYDWDAFTDNIIDAIAKKPSIPQKFYDTYYWGNIAKNVYSILSEQ